MKKCIKCLKEFDLSNFPKNASKANGYNSTCKDCMKIYLKDYHIKNRDKNNKKAGEYQKKNKVKHNKTTAEWRKRNRQKEKAHYTVNNMIVQGKLKREPCRVCGKPDAEAHHEDYSKPLEIDWLCKKHHVARHTELREKSLN